jgi:formate dehydrogenase subunit delta
METRDMVRMANQIADYFKAYPEGQAIKEVAGHIRSFWEPHMRDQLTAYIAKGGADLHPLVLKAVHAMKAAA